MPLDSDKRDAKTAPEGVEAGRPAPEKLVPEKLVPEELAPEKTAAASQLSDSISGDPLALNRSTPIDSAETSASSDFPDYITRYAEYARELDAMREERSLPGGAAGNAPDGASPPPPSGPPPAASPYPDLPEPSGDSPPAEEDETALDDYDPDADDEDDEEDTGEGEREEAMTLRDHLRELRKRLVRILLATIAGFMGAYFFSDILVLWLYLPLTKVLPEGSNIISTGMAENFLVHVKVALLAGFFATSPFCFYQIWAFIAPGLYNEEKRLVVPIAMISALFFFSGAAFCYFVVFPVAFDFFMGFSNDTFRTMPSMAEYFSFVLRMIFAFGFIFELPLFSFFLSRLGIVTAGMMRRFRRYSIVLCVIVAAILTPPDVSSQMLMAVPLLALYEISILVAAVFGKKKEAVPDEDDDPDEGQDKLADAEAARE